MRTGRGFARDHVPRAVVVVDPREPELLDVAADRGLRGGQTQLGQTRPDLVLRAETLLAYQGEDRLLALFLLKPGEGKLERIRRRGLCS